MSTFKKGYNRKITWFSALTAVATFALVWVGGLVTSHGAGLAVPDWPNSYGYNMFFFPISKWIGGIFYEHTHRLLASGVGVMTTILTLWLYGAKSRPVLRWGGAVLIVFAAMLRAPFPDNVADEMLLGATGVIAFVVSFFWPACETAPFWQRYLGLIAFAAVVVQGILGGLRVTELKNWLGIIHGTVAQLFFLLVSAITLFRTKYWERLASAKELERGRVKILFFVTTALIVIQLIIGATMRHQHAGLAIPDFPLAYGKIWPALDSRSISLYNQQRIEIEGDEPITAFQIILQMTHRIIAFVIFGAVLVCFRRTWQAYGPRHCLSKWAGLWFAVVLAQAILGMATIWTGKSADIATLHVAFGALGLLVGGLLSILAARLLAASDLLERPERQPRTPSASLSQWSWHEDNAGQRIAGRARLQ